MSVRSRLAGDLESQYDKVVAALEEAMESTKKAWGYCPSCRKKVHVDFPDHGARITAVELWLEQGFGRPGTGAVLESAASRGSRQTLDELEALTMDQLAAYLWSLESDEERARRRRLLDGMEASEWPLGFAEALSSGWSGCLGNRRKRERRDSRSHVY